MRLPPVQKSLLSYLSIHTWSVASVLQQQLQHRSPQATHQLLKRMIAKGLISSADIQLPAQRKVRLFGITEVGLAYAFDLDEEVTTTRYFEPSKVSPSTLQHELDIQLAHVNASIVGWSDWRNGSVMGKRITNMKIPDAIATSPKGHRICIEIEREIKSARRYRDIIASHLSARKRGQWEHILYLSPDLDFAKRLKRKINSLGYLLWNGCRVSLTEEHLKYFTFASYDFFTEEVPLCITQ